jgi:hypothetical protein
MTDPRTEDCSSVKAKAWMPNGAIEYGASANRSRSRRRFAKTSCVDTVPPVSSTPYPRPFEAAQGQGGMSPTGMTPGAPLVSSCTRALMENGGLKRFLGGGFGRGPYLRRPFASVASASDHRNRHWR